MDVKVRLPWQCRMTEKHCRIIIRFGEMQKNSYSAFKFIFIKFIKILREWYFLPLDPCKPEVLVDFTLVNSSS